MYCITQNLSPDLRPANCRQLPVDPYREDNLFFPFHSLRVAVVSVGDQAVYTYHQLHVQHVSNVNVQCL